MFGVEVVDIPIGIFRDRPVISLELLRRRQQKENLAQKRLHSDPVMNRLDQFSGTRAITHTQIKATVRCARNRPLAAEIRPCMTIEKIQRNSPELGRKHSQLVAVDL